MIQHKKLSKSMALLLSSILVMSSGDVAVAAQSYNSNPKNMYETELLGTSNNVLLRSSTVTSSKEDPVTVGDVLKEINNLLGASLSYDDMSSIRNLNKSSNYYKVISTALNAGYIKTDKNNAVTSPKAKVTMNYMATVFSRLLGVDKAEIIGNTNPTAKITKSDLSGLLKKYAPNVITDSTSKDYKGTVVINEPGIVLSDMTIDGDLVLGDGIASGKTELKNVKVTGKVIVRGGGSEALIITGDSNIADIRVNQVNYSCGVILKDQEIAPNITIAKESKGVVINGDIKELNIQNSNQLIKTADSNIENIVISGKKAKLQLEESTQVTSIVVNKNAASCQLTVKGKVETMDINASKSTIKTESTAKIEMIVSNGDMTNVQGVGTITNIKVNGNDTTISVPNSKVDTVTGGTSNQAPAGNDSSTGSQTPSTPPSTPSVDDTENEYSLVWEDEFEGTELNMDNWNYEKHQPGWVNNELQEYTDSTENIYLEDGKLVIKANKTTDADDKDHYTSGKVTTQNKQNFKYGKFEIKAKVVDGQGLWPAIWMMPQDENFYGQWPRCGEIDIMECLGHEPNKIYSTIHYGNPHKEQQGEYVLESGTYADDYHIYTAEWEPGKISFYVDDNCVNTVTDWYTKTEGKGEIAYPAPFDQYFYLQFNMAVGGNWPGSPDESTNFDNAKFMIDYVKVYQKDSYDENVARPEKPEVTFREPDETGNYIVNGDFSDQEDLSDDVNWGEKYALGGVGTVSLKDGQMVIETTEAGTVDYSVQIVQPNLPMKKGGEYKLTFDAYADEARTVIVDISGPDNSYVRYFADTKVALDTEKSSYEYVFTMTNDNDANGRLEFNLGNQNSTGTVYISNVRLEKIGQAEIQAPDKTVLADGNYVYNGEFQEGLGRLDYWTVIKGENTTVAVTNDEGRRELMVNAPDGVTLNEVLVSQDVAIVEGKEYVLTFDAYADQIKNIEVNLNGNKFEPTLTTEKSQYKYSFSTSDGVTAKELIFDLGNAGVTYIDNVRLAEAGLLVNGDFVNDFVGWTAFVDSGISSNVTYTVDHQKEDGAAAFEIRDTSDAEWKIQLMQDGVNLINGKTYELSFKAKTDLPEGRELAYAIQHNGSSDDDWTPYSGNKIAELGTSYQVYKVKFTMTSETDANSRLSFSMGAVGGTQISTTHNIYIDDVVLVEAEPDPVEVPVGEGNMIKNADFTLGEDGFENWERAVTAPGEAVFSSQDGKLNVDITNIGSLEWHIQLKQKLAGLVNGHKYSLKMKVTSSEDRMIKVALLTSGYEWYGGANINLKANELTDISQPIDVTLATTDDITFIISMGKITDGEITAGNLVIQDLWLEDITE